MQLALASLDPLVELVEERGGVVPAREAAERLFAVRQAPAELPLSLLQPLVEEDARLSWGGSFVALAETASPALTDTHFVVFDLETTGLAAGSARICEIGAVRVERLELRETFETLVAPGVRLPAPVGRLTGLSDGELRAAPGIAVALRRFSAFAGDATLVAHNASFDLGFLNRDLARLTGMRLAAQAIDTLPLARNLLHGRVERTSLASLASFFGVSVEPCHRALPDAQATAEILLQLILLARDGGASTLAELAQLAAPKLRRAHAKRRLVHGAPARPGVYLFRDRAGRVLYVGKARDLRARLWSYIETTRRRQSLETALAATEQIEWRVLGSEFAAALAEAALIRELRPAANGRALPGHDVYLRRRGRTVVASRFPTPYGPLRRGSAVREAARALRGCTQEEFERLLRSEALARPDGRLAALSPAPTGEAERPRGGTLALEAVVGELRRLARLRRLQVCVLVPALEQGCDDAYVVCDGRVAVRRLLNRRSDPLAEVEAMLADARVACTDTGPATGADLDAVAVVATFLTRRPPELRATPLDARLISAALASRGLVA